MLLVLCIWNAFHQSNLQDHPIQHTVIVCLAPQELQDDFLFQFVLTFWLLKHCLHIFYPLFLCFRQFDNNIIYIPFYRLNPLRCRISGKWQPICGRANRQAPTPHIQYYDYSDNIVPTILQKFRILLEKRVCV